MKNSKKTAKILIIVCAVVSIFGLCAMGINAAASLSADFKSAKYAVGSGPAASTVTGMPGETDYNYTQLAPGAEKYELPVLKTSDSNYQFAGWSDNNGRQDRFPVIP